MSNAIIASYRSYNHRRYSTPWVCLMNADGSYDFSTKVGIYSGNGSQGEAGDLVVYEPVERQVYGYGQKDYRGGNTEKNFAKFIDGAFAPCDKLGRVK